MNLKYFKLFAALSLSLSAQALFAPEARCLHHRRKTACVNALLKLLLQVRCVRSLTNAVDAKAKQYSAFAA